MSPLLAPFKELKPFELKTGWTSPSNIAFIKYWGKKGHQIPANPSLSMTLKECTTSTTVHFIPSSDLTVSLKLDRVPEVRFAEKIKKYLETLQSALPCLRNLQVDIETTNTFPHGAGIASSASGLSAFALCLTDYLHKNFPEDSTDLFFKRASFLSRLASGSACRSVYGGFSTWGKSDDPGSSDEYATPMEVHPELSHLKDTVLIISDKEKDVSSRQGHDRMIEHAFAESRFSQARTNFKEMMVHIQSGAMDEVGRILESEALSLHAMMLTSPVPYTLFRPNTLAAIERIWDFRKETKLPLYFTLDAGPNLHLIYPDSHKKKISDFITNELSGFALKIIDDERGEGPVQCL